MTVKSRALHHTGPARLLGVCGLAAALALAGVAASPAYGESKAASGDLEPIKLELPQPSYASTPLNYYRANLETPGFKDRPPFLAPKGVVDISKGKPVTSSVAPNMGKLELITDGDKQYADKAIVGVGSGTQYVQIDLGAVHELYAIVIWHFHANQRVYFDVVVQVSDDAEFKKDVNTVFNNDDDNSSGLGVGQNNEYVETHEGKLIDTKGVKGRYLRLYSKGNTTDDVNHYIEVEVFGKPAS